MKESRKNRGIGVFSVVVICFLTAFCLMNIKSLTEPIPNLWEEDATFGEFVDEVQKNYTSDFSLKNQFVNLNGLFARLTGKKVHNEVNRLDNGMLVGNCVQFDVSPNVKNVAAFSEYVNSMGIPFLYVQAPCKPGADDSLLPGGIESFADSNADDMVRGLLENGVSVVDLRSSMSATREHLEKYFYYTDHHWNTAGGFYAFQQISEEIQSLFPERATDMTYTQENQWNVEVYEDWFLGSHGKRVGVFYGGIDDLLVYTPEFETDMSCAVNKYRALYSGDFVGANMRLNYLENGPDYFEHNAYCVYIGGDYPLVQHRNNMAPNDLKLLVIKDSFVLPVQSFLSTVFSEVDVVDPRYLKECTVAEYVDMTKPDVVILLTNPSLFTNQSFYSYGVDQMIAYKTKTTAEHILVENSDVEVAPKDAAYNYRAVASGLEFGKCYTLRFDDVVFTQGDAPGVVFALYNATTKEIISSCPFDVKYYRNKGEFVWTFRTPDSGSGNLELLGYAGVAGACNGIGVKYVGVEVSVEDVS